MILSPFSDLGFVKNVFKFIVAVVVQLVVVLLDTIHAVFEFDEEIGRVGLIGELGR